MLAASQKGETGLRKMLSKPGLNRRITLIIGPEGDFTEKEYRFFEKINAGLYSLGSLVLRTETAAITSVALAVNSSGES